MRRNFFYLGVIAAVIIIIFEKNTLIKANSNISEEKQRTYKSFMELIIKSIASTMEPSNQTFIGKSFSEILEKFEKEVHLIFPGTKWCGPGNIASDYDDLGVFNDTDSCCRTHDSCKKNIPAGETLGPLINDGTFVRSACSCDHKFYCCLKKAKSLLSKSIGETYFNVLQPQCFAMDYPIESCAEYQKIIENIGKKCVKYNFDTSKPKKLQWFDNKHF